MNDNVPKATLSVAAWLELEASCKQLEAATIRGDMASATAHRQRAHDMLDSNLDLRAGNIIDLMQRNGR